MQQESFFIRSNNFVGEQKISIQTYKSREQNLGLLGPGRSHPCRRTAKLHDQSAWCYLDTLHMADWNLCSCSNPVHKL